MSWLSKLAIRCIDRYQMKGGSKALLNIECNFTPSCSEYAKESLSRFGFCQGITLAFKRICRCNQPDLVYQINDPVPNRVINKGKTG